MKTRFRLITMLNALLTLSVILVACAPTATPTIAPVTTEAATQPETSIPIVTEAATQPPTQQPTQQPTTVPTEAAPVTITFWHAYNADTEGKYLDETIIPAFEANHPNIKVEAVNVPWDPFRRKLLIALSGGTAPDLARVDIAWTTELADTGALANLEDLIPEFATYKDTFLTGPLSTNLYQGKYYGLPLDTNTRVLAFNKAVFAAAGIQDPPKTIDDMLADCAKIKALGTGTYCFADGGTYGWAVLPWIWEFGGAVTDPAITTSTGYYNSPETAAAYKFLKDGIDNGYFHPGMAGGGVDQWGGLGKGQIAMILEGPWFPTAFGQQFPDVQFGLTSVPAGADGSISVVGGEDIVLFKQSIHKAEALEFMQYMLSEEVQLQMLSVGQVPVLKSAIDSDTVKNHPYIGIFLDQLKTAKARTPHPNWNKIETIMSNTGTAILSGQVDIQTGLDEAVVEIDKLLPIQP
jgi:multiple sugar transport system substrate-binding protein